MDKLPPPKRVAQAKQPLQLPPLKPTPLNLGMLQIVKMFFKHEELQQQSKDSKKT